MRRSAIGIGLSALAAGLLGGGSLGPAQADGQRLAPPARSLAQDVTRRLEAAPAPEASPGAFETAPDRTGERPPAREISRSMRRAAEEVRRER